MFLGHPIYEELKNLIGEEATRKIAERYGRGRLYLPRPKKTAQCSCSDCPFARDFAAFQKRLRSMKLPKIETLKPLTKKIKSSTFRPSKPVFL